MDDMRLASTSSRDAPAGSRIEDIKAQLEIEAKSRIETTRTIRNNERVIESQKKALKENEEQISRQQSDLLSADQRVQGLKSELDDLVSTPALRTMNNINLVTFSTGGFSLCLKLRIVVCCDLQSEKRRKHWNEWLDWNESSKDSG
jgi:hypothetical protein